MLRTHASAPTWRSVSVFCALLLFPLASLAQVPLNEISKDPFTNIGPQHATEVEPDTFSFGNTIVTAFQQGRFNLNGGCSDIGWATSLDGGMTWQNGSLPGLTRNLGGGKFARVSDPAVAFDAAHSTWMIASLPLQASGSHTAMLISRSSDGINWSNPVNVTPAVENSDKTWVACDNNTASPFYGHCYAEWDDNFAGDVIFLNTSTDGGMTWGPSKQPAGGPTGLGGQPMAQPGGLVIVPSSDAFLSSLLAYTSSDGGNTWTETTLGKDYGNYSFREWTCHFTPKNAGNLELQCCALNRKGETQPKEPRWNPSGYMRNVIETVRVTAA